MPNKSIKWIREPVSLFVYTKTKLEPLTTYAGRYVSAMQNNKIPALRKVFSSYESVKKMEGCS